MVRAKLLVDIRYIDTLIAEGSEVEVVSCSGGSCTILYEGKIRYANMKDIEVIDSPPTIERPDSDHYHTGGIDVWKFAEANFSYDEVFGFHRIDAIKYLTRFGKKQGRNIRDLEKARAEIDEMIRMEKEREANE